MRYIFYILVIFIVIFMNWLWKAEQHERAIYEERVAGYLLEDKDK